MDKMQLFRSSGIVLGLIVGLIICIPVIKYMNKDKKLKTEYDERQEVARGRAYRYAFWSMCGALAFVMVLELFDITVATSFAKYFFVMFVGLIVQVAVSIWNNAYYGINTNKKRCMIVCIFAGACNLFAFVGNIMSGQFIVDGVIQDSGANLLCFILLIFAGVELFIKDRIETKAASVEGSGDDE